MRLRVDDIWCELLAAQSSLLFATGPICTSFSFDKSVTLQKTARITSVFSDAKLKVVAIP
jgi:hypothetical protein